MLIKVKKQMGVVLMKHWQNLLMDMLYYKTPLQKSSLHPSVEQVKVELV